MRRRHVPVAQRRGLVDEQSGVHPQRDFAHRVGEIQIRRRRVDGVRLADDHQHLDAARLHVGDELAQGGVLFGRHDLRRRLIADGCADVAQRLIDRMRERVHRRRLRIAGDDERRAAMRDRSAAIAST